jgi:hypothetical protein
VAVIAVSKVIFGLDKKDYQISKGILAIVRDIDMIHNKTYFSTYNFMLTRNYWTYGLFTIRCKLANDLHVFYGSSIIALYETNTIKNNLIYQIIQLYSEHRGEIAGT